MEETERTENEDYEQQNYKKGYTDIEDPDINVELPSGAMKGLKDATKDLKEDKRLDTELMQNKLQESLKIEKKKKGIEVETIIVDD